MTEEEFKKQVKKVLYERAVTNYEFLSLADLIKRHKLQYEFVLIAVQFARLIKGPAVHINYILAIINDWLEHNIRNPGTARQMLLDKNWVYNKKAKKPTLEKHEYTKEKLDGLFDTVFNFIT